MGWKVYAFDNNDGRNENGASYQLNQQNPFLKRCQIITPSCYDVLQIVTK